MWALSANRRLLLEVLGSEHSSSSASSTSSRAKKVEKLPTFQEELALLWPRVSDPASEPPTAIAVRDGALGEFLGWSATYLPEFGALSGYFRVAPRREIQQALGSATTPGLGEWNGAAVGLIFGEIMASTTHARAEVLSPVLCSTAASFAMARGLALAYPADLVIGITDSWADVRRASQQRERALDLASIRSAWGALLVASGTARSDSLFAVESDDVFGAALGQIRTTGRVSDRLWSELTGSAPSLATAHEAMTQSREARVRWLDDSLEGLVRAGGSSPTLAAFLVGYTLAQLAPSSFRMLDLVESALERAPGSAIWYGAVSGVLEPREMLRIGGGLGYRLLRDLLRHEPLLSRPSSDICAAEFLTLSQTESSSMSIVQANPGRLQVELLPCVSTTLSWSQGRSESKREASVDDLDRVRSLLMRARSDIERIGAELDVDLGPKRAKKRAPKRKAAKEKSKRRKRS